MTQSNSSFTSASVHYPGSSPVEILPNTTAPHYRQQGTKMSSPSSWDVETFKNGKKSRLHVVNPGSQDEVQPEDPKPIFLTWSQINHLETEKYYRMKDLIAGDQGSVSLVRNKSSGKLGVIKRPYGSTMEGVSPDIEARCLTYAKHTSIVDLQETLSRPSAQPAMVFEHCNGGDLHNLIMKYLKGNYKIPEPFIWHCFSQMAEALAYLHYGYDAETKTTKPNWKTIVHRDIKPENFFLKQIPDKYPRIVLGDFGLAAFPSDPGHKDVLLQGTREYRGPEIPIATAESDVWGIGAIIHLMIHGMFPIVVPKAVNMASMGPHHDWLSDPRTRRSLPDTSAYSSFLQNWLNKCLQHDPRKRISSADLARDLKLQAKLQGKYRPLPSWALPPSPSAT
ncbi:G2-specific serine/threonine protein kinase [Agyrium rufum]|nr:G2-specific serine/threonine protein kinase [Agyrium rufum]